MESRAAANKRQLVELIVGFAAAVTIVSAVVFGLLGHIWFGLFFGLAVAALWLVTAWLRADNMVLKICEAKPVSKRQHARLINVTNGLCAVMGLTPPRLYWIDDRALNAMAVGRDGRHSAIVVTRGLYEEASLVELEAAVALELSKIKSRETAVSTLAIGTVGASWVLSEHFDGVEILRRLFGLPVGLVQKVLIKLHPAREDLLADIAAVLVTRYPPAMASLLEKMAGRTALVTAPPVTAVMWMAPPVPPAGRAAELQRLHLPLQQRISVLQEL